MTLIVPLTDEDQATVAHLPLWLLASYHHAFLMDVSIMNARTRVKASPVFKELMVMRLRHQERMAELHRKFLLH